MDFVAECASVCHSAQRMPSSLPRPSAAKMYPICATEEYATIMRVVLARMALTEPAIIPIAPKTNSTSQMPSERITSKPMTRTYTLINRKI